MNEPVTLDHLADFDFKTFPSIDRLRYQEILIDTFSEPVPYLQAWDLQSRLHNDRIVEHRADSLLILEHSPVYTLGRRTRPSDLGENEAMLRKNGTELYHVNRGGSVTYHGPGQVVLYPILKVDQYAAGAKQLVWLIEEVLLRLLKHWGIAGHRIVGKPGMWVLQPHTKKIGFVGIRIQRGVTLHGASLNVDLDLDPFSYIVPCGLPDCSVTSMAAVSQQTISVPRVKHQLAQIFATVFSEQLRQRSDMERHSSANSDPEGAPCRNC